MFPTFSDQIARDHIAELRSEARVDHLVGCTERPAARERLGIRLVALGERLISSSR